MPSRAGKIEILTKQVRGSDDLTIKTDWTTTCNCEGCSQRDAALFLSCVLDMIDERGLVYEEILEGAKQYLKDAVTSKVVH
jgi:hypothetical protein